MSSFRAGSKEQVRATCLSRVVRGPVDLLALWRLAFRQAGYKGGLDEDIAPSNPVVYIT
jgi:hypothetical protein